MQPNLNLNIHLELISWKTVVDVTGDKKVLKKLIKVGEGYDRPNEGSLVKGNFHKLTLFVKYMCKMKKILNVWNFMFLKWFILESYKMGLYLTGKDQMMNPLNMHV